ncbi:putative cation efflux system protein; zinc transporter (zitB-like) [Bradyrhizobium sp. ORS 375]|uniref:CDF family Co(II)/Ni(II) efflux transporter DmeF n=1 Tax=Bradyrhizobium sp. (strain ORS 375) TaxID=566679 RepID=UPI000240579E|nr:CDF family Co(II)/Ni(II) efflux transporter DmeF [Bradyrhizobium sp. ORS 375]CCD91179.1 putative cation efflux system protein; zinc transporter (zitB-like) [Bradyrhizobium sp. ORS 375]
MPSQADHWAHDHIFLGAQHERNERRTWVVVGLTLVMMAGEIAAGSLFGSMALLADGWHMGTHAAALGIAGLAYLFARRHARNPSFTFGTGKFGELAAFSSALILLIIAVQVAYESVVRLLSPQPIAYGEAIAVAVLGLLVNLVSAWLLAGEHGHHHHGHSHHAEHHHHDHGDHHHDHDHHHGHHDNNLRAAYLHVLADAATSLLAIGALLIGMYLGWSWADAAVGLVGSAVIASWAFGLIRDAGAVLLDVNGDRRLEATIRARLEASGDRVTDLHLWQVGPGHRAVVVSIVSNSPLAPAMYKQRLRDLRGLSHVTVEVEQGLHA